MILTSMQKYTSGTAMLQASADYWVDMKDYFMYGDQFLNYDPTTATTKNVVALPRPALAGTDKRYPVSADIDVCSLLQPRRMLLTKTALFR